MSLPVLWISSGIIIGGEVERRLVVGPAMGNFLATPIFSACRNEVVAPCANGGQKEFGDAENRTRCLMQVFTADRK